MKREGGSNWSSPPEKTTPKKPSLIRVNCKDNIKQTHEGGCKPGHIVQLAKTEPVQNEKAILTYF